MDKIIQDFMTRNLPNFVSDFIVEIGTEKKDTYRIKFNDGKVFVNADCYISAINGIYRYLRDICHVNLSWNGNREIKIDRLVSFDGEVSYTIPQKYRVYMNYCTLNYSMSFWNWERWEKEIDFMAMNGINMPLAVVGTEAVWYETLLELGFTSDEALSTISGPCFWAWQLMTNIEGYIPPKDKNYVYERLELGKKILHRVCELGMFPIQQGFSGHVPVLLKEKFPKAKILDKRNWCLFPKTAQLDPLDPLFEKFGNIYLNKLEKLMGNYHFLACDPFHEGSPPKPWFWYLKSVGKAIDRLYKNFDNKSVWVMQSWSINKHIATAVPKDRLLILDIDSQKSIKMKNLWQYPVVAGMLHDFGGKNAMQGKLRHHSKNVYATLKNNGTNVVGSGLFMEGIEQNPVVYDLQFELLTTGQQIDLDKWIDDYIVRRYGKTSKTLRKAWDILFNTCYRDGVYNEPEVGSLLCARPSMFPEKASPCDFTKIYYDTKEFEKALHLFASVADEFNESDGYQYDLCDIARQAMSNRFYDNQREYSEAYKSGDIEKVKLLTKLQLDLLTDLDSLLSNRSEFCLSRWINDSHDLATNDEEKKYFDRNARTLITLWGDVDGDTCLFDYAWREWSGLIKEYYYPRWEVFYSQALIHLENGTKFVLESGIQFFGRTRLRSTEFGKKLAEFENQWCKTYSEYDKPTDKNVVPTVNETMRKWFTEAK